MIETRGRSPKRRTPKPHAGGPVALPCLRRCAKPSSCRRNVVTKRIPDFGFCSFANVLGETMKQHGRTRRMSDDRSSEWYTKQGSPLHRRCSAQSHATRDRGTLYCCQLDPIRSCSGAPECIFRLRTVPTPRVSCCGNGCSRRRPLAATAQVQFFPPPSSSRRSKLREDKEEKSDCEGARRKNNTIMGSENRRKGANNERNRYE